MYISWKTLCNNCVITDNKPLNLHINGHAKDLSKYSNGKSDDDEDMEDDRLSDDDRDDGKCTIYKYLCIMTTSV